MTLFRKHLSITGFVQGVGFRPFIYNLASEHQLTGWILNDSAGIQIEVQGPRESLEGFMQKVKICQLPNASIYHIDISEIPAIKEESFTIKQSEHGGSHHSFIVPDLATCKKCIEDLTNPHNRRYRYPFTNCTHCGPRFSIIERLPYDRAHTTMKHFTMCKECSKEYTNPQNRRFHAQPNACPQCGPQLELWDAFGRVVAEQDDALTETCRLIKEGKILAVKGLGGFHLMVDAQCDQSILKLRERKQRPHKPFALMYPTIDFVKKDCSVSLIEEELLTSKEAPIVILKAEQFPSPFIAPGNPYLGVMLPYTPLHHLMMEELKGPVIATSGNQSNEPICTDEKTVLSDLQGIADYFLVHNRPIIRGVDDSVVRVINGESVIIRRSRGYSSIPIFIDQIIPPSLALGGHQKSTIAVANGKMITISQHLGDLETDKACENFQHEVSNAMSLYSVNPEFVVADSHPDYFSSRMAEALDKPIKRCQHHEAHVYACIAENRLEPLLLGVSWDGTGYGSDGTIWGGEFFRVNEDFTMKRVATIRPFRLLCGEKAVREPRLVALSLLYEVFGLEVFSRDDLPVVSTFSTQEVSNYEKMLSRGFLSPVCSSMGRLFDGVSALLGICHGTTFEGQAAMELEFLSELSDEKSFYSFELIGGIIDWVPMIGQILQDINKGVAKSDIAAKFHNTLVRFIQAVTQEEGLSQVVLSGGVFQNKRLVEQTVACLENQGLDVFTHQNIPPNDGGISCGQLFASKIFG